MKVQVIGYLKLKGTSKAGNPFDGMRLYYTTALEGRDNAYGYEAADVWIDTSRFTAAFGDCEVKDVVGKKFDFYFDRRQQLDAVRPL